MNARELIQALKPLRGFRIAVRSPSGNWTFDCYDVMHLPPDERRDDAGNVILWTGTRDEKGRPEGPTMWARNVWKVERLSPSRIYILGMNGKRVRVLMMGKIE